MALFSKPIKKTSAPIIQITDVIKKMSNDLQRNTEFIHVAKVFTSQRRNQCKTKNFANTILTRSKQKIHAILKCDSCRMVWGRDVMAANSIHYILHTCHNMIMKYLPNI